MLPVNENQMLLEKERESARVGVSDSSTFIRRFGFHLLVGTFVLVMSFAYGVSAGLQKSKSSRAFASLQGENLLLPESVFSRMFSRIDLPSDIIPIPLGQDITINSKRTDFISFVTDRTPASVVLEQAEKWERQGMKLLKAATPLRAFVIGLDDGRGERYWMSAWIVPPVFRSTMSMGKRVQGFFSIIDSSSKVPGDVPTGEIPGVQIMPGGKGGAVFSSMDTGGRSYTSVYTNPGSLDEGMQFYRNELFSAGWTEVSATEDIAEQMGAAVGSLTFFKGNEEIVLLFSPVLGGSLSADGSMERTTVLVTRGPRQVSSGRMIFEK